MTCRSGSLTPRQAELSGIHRPNTWIGLKKRRATLVLSNRPGASPGPKTPLPKKRDVNSDGVQVRPTRPDVYGPTDDAGFLTAEFQSGDLLGDDLDFQNVDRPFEILPLGEPTKLKNPFKRAKNCEGISACETVAIVRGIVSRAGQTSLGRRAPEQARSAGTQRRQTHHTRARRMCDKTIIQGQRCAQQCRGQKKHKSD